MSSEALEEGARRFLIGLSEALGVRLSKILDIYFSVTPRRARILEIVEEGGRVVGLRMAVESGSRRGVWHYVSVGPYGAKCTCEANTIRGLICSHIVAALITWNMVSLIKTGEPVDVKSLGWLRRAGQK
ncbi:MAG: SWIM zinc finger family protein [Thermoproteus sp. AZ2]|jgi:hypothetical protein|uniref:SWIM zinc finger family protein n=1 Tax=Thermoproteus sp. AZ2 TaxID=1609232 RepID=A0ACC6V0B3_9CREN|nr:MAG: hypothetical protein TU35_06535 [Thermoproteus sp. AZ2]